MKLQCALVVKSDFQAEAPRRNPGNSDPTCLQTELVPDRGEDCHGGSCRKRSSKSCTIIYLIGYLGLYIEGFRCVAWATRTQDMSSACFALAGDSFLLHEASDPTDPDAWMSCHEPQPARTTLIIGNSCSSRNSNRHVLDMMFQTWHKLWERRYNRRCPRFPGNTEQAEPCSCTRPILTPQCSCCRNLVVPRTGRRQWPHPGLSKPCSRRWRCPLGYRPLAFLNRSTHWSRGAIAASKFAGLDGRHFFWRPRKPEFVETNGDITDKSSRLFLGRRVLCEHASTA